VWGAWVLGEVVNMLQIYKLASYLLEGGTKPSRSGTFNSASKMSTNRFNSRVGFFTSNGCALRVSSHPTSICLRMSLRRSENVPTGATMVRNDMIGYALHFCGV
jgi:hypothetical protein